MNEGVFKQWFNRRLPLMRARWWWLYTWINVNDCIITVSVLFPLPHSPPNSFFACYQLFFLLFFFFLLFVVYCCCYVEFNTHSHNWRVWVMTNTVVWQTVWNLLPISFGRAKTTLLIVNWPTNNPPSQSQ